jgi:redox-sensitive bicupin YhaK (pirin superfamily)
MAYSEVMSNLERESAPTLSGECRPAEKRPVQEVLAGREVDLGGGTRVLRLLPTALRATVGAWCFVDHFGPHDIAGRPGMRVPPHPHIGLQTVTWLIDGEVLHRDSLGNRLSIRPGELNLMTAGRGIAHSEESPPDHPRALHGVQLWTALPARSGRTDPGFEHVPELPVAETGGARVTMLVGEMLDARSPARAWSELFGADVEVRSSAAMELPLRADFEYGAVVLAGEASIDGIAVRPASLLYLGTGRREVAVRADRPARILLLGGVPFDEPLFMWWNFVGHSAEEIEEARSDWEAGRRFGEVHGFDGPRMEAPSLPTGRLRPRA